MSNLPFLANNQVDYSPKLPICLPFCKNLKISSGRWKNVESNNRPSMKRQCKPPVKMFVPAPLLSVDALAVSIMSLATKIHAKGFNWEMSLINDQGEVVPDQRDASAAHQYPPPSSAAGG
ncbi:tetratricopeptide repeat protein [Striga asiatica]|uniref:Tetratricopeptide repeat protein n=1 Tax=Striga asiatica TaxID=4170 RepID=A0A5A7PM47_STRAF|nr:tetratricopeptide repeat protein [Striga asiatica]